MSRKSRTTAVMTGILILLALLSASSAEAQPPPLDEPGPDAAFGATNPAHRRSDSPWLQLPAELKNVPRVLPSRPAEPATEASPDPRTMELYDISTGAISHLPPDHPTYLEIESYRRQTPEYLGLLPAGIAGFESVLPPDGRTQVSPTTSFPWRTVVDLYMSFPDGAAGGCSGAIIGCADGHGYHVLTAGHCVYSHDHGGWATSVRVIPGLDDDYMPYNYAWATHLRSYTGWTQLGQTQHDWAMITLDRNIGDFTGWMGRQTCNPPGDCPVYTGTLNTAGYPGDKGGETLWFDADSGHSVDDLNHWYYMDTAGGQSGSPVWVYYSSSDERNILTVHTCGTGGCGISGKDCNHGTRLDQDKYDRINTWCSEDSPPADRADLIDDGQDWSGFSPAAVLPGATSFHAWSDVRNVGTAASGGFYVSYYASANATISTSDHLIGSDYVASISPFSWDDADWESTFPGGIPDGLYYVGWIVDSGNAVTEFDEGNNSAYKSAYRLLVDGTAPANPTSLSSASHTPGAWSTDDTVTVSWSGASDGSGSGVYGYSYEWSTAATTLPDTTVDTTGNSTTSPALGNSSNWYFHIRTRDNVGNWNSGAIHLGPFPIDITTPTNPTSAAETHGAAGSSWQNAVGDPAFTWSGASDGSGSGVAGYYVYWGASPSGTATTWTTSASYDPAAVSSPGAYYLRLQTGDNAGNTGDWTTLFTFQYDASPPSSPTLATEVHGAAGGSWQNAVGDPAFTWSGASDGTGSGIAGYYVYWGASPSGTATTWTATASYDPGAVSSPGIYYLRLQSEDNAGNTSAWTTLFTFQYDASPPTNPSSLSSSSHTAGVWSTHDTVTVNWSGASDGSGSGVYGYSYEWSTSASTLPDTTPDTTATSATSPALGEGDNWYFHIRACDNAGNWSGEAAHLGPFLIDATAPANPTSVTETHGAEDNRWQNSVGNPAFTWSASDGNGSGVAGYYIYWGASPSGTSSTWITSAGYDPEAVPSPRVYYLRLQTKDHAGNTSDWATVFGFQYDASPPANPSTISSPTHTPGVWSSDDTIATNWSGATDGSGSGIYGYSYEWSTSAATLPDTTPDTTATSVTGPPLGEGDHWYFCIRAQDNAGNWNSDAHHSGPYLLDLSAPACAVDPLPASQEAISFVVSWLGDDAAPGSGLESYDVQVRVGPDGAWTDWLANTQVTTRTFGPVDPVALQNGQVYFFRCRARDRAGNLGTYAGGDGDAWTTLYKHTVLLPLVRK